MLAAVVIANVAVTHFAAMSVQSSNVVRERLVATLDTGSTSRRCREPLDGLRGRARGGRCGRGDASSIREALCKPYEARKRCGGAGGTRARLQLLLGQPDAASATPDGPEGCSAAVGGPID
jgi:hypothetical protein